MDDGVSDQDVVEICVFAQYLFNLAAYIDVFSAREQRYVSRGRYIATFPRSTIPEMLEESTSQAYVRQLVRMPREV